MSEERRSGPHGEHRHKPEDDAAEPGRRSEPVRMKDDPSIPDPSGDEPSGSERDSTMVNDSSSEGGGGQSG